MAAEPTAALVTGGARGIGRAVAERLAARGDTVFVGDLEPPEGGGGGLRWVELDVRDAGAAPWERTPSGPAGEAR